MLSPAELAKLDEAFRKAQARVLAGVGSSVFLLHKAMDLEDLTEAESDVVESFLTRATALIEGGARRTASNADAFYDVVRRGQGIPGTAPIKPLDPVDVARIRTSLFVTGVVGARKRVQQIPGGPTLLRPPADPEGPGVPQVDRQLQLLSDGRELRIREALESSGMAAAGAAIRHTGNAGREQIKGRVAIDPKATGYARVTRANPCYFCAMLASRGAVYTRDAFDESDARFEGPGTAKVHDNCQCAMRPMFTRSESEWPEFNQKMHELWESGEMDGGVSVAIAWRRLYEGRSQE
jgi:hypothetical protein